jgi:hypothetical protein
MTKPSIGRIVHYTLSEQDAEAINRRRADARAHLPEHQENANGVQVHTGNDVKPGDVYPLIITRVWGDTPESAANGQVLLDGNDLFWATSVSHGTGERKFVWPSY